MMTDGSLSGNCRNCGERLVGKFCSVCGQKADTHRYTWHELGHGLIHSVFHVDSGIFFTLRQLFTRPGHMVREYLEGKRKGHFNAFTLLLTLTAICSFLYVHFHIETYLASVKLNDLEEKSPLIVHKYFAIRALFFLLLCATGDWLVFRDRGYAFPEMIVANAYYFSAVSALQILICPLLLWLQDTAWGATLRLLVLAPVLIYLVWTRRQFYRAGNDAKMNAKVILLVAFLFLVAVGVGRWLVKPYLLQLGS